MRPLLLLMCACGLVCQEAPPEHTFGTTVVLPSGLRGDIYLLRDRTFILPDFERRNMKAVGSVWTTSLKVPPRRWRDGFPGVTNRFEWFAINYTGRFWIEEPGRYQFALLSDDGANLYIDDQLVIDNDCRHPPAVRAAYANLSGGVHRIRVPYFQGPRDCVALMLAVAGPKGQWRAFSTDDFKPPTNPADWKFNEAGNAPLQISADDEPPTIEELIAALGLEKTASGSAGCIAYPSRDCGR